MANMRYCILDRIGGSGVYFYDVRSVSYEWALNERPGYWTIEPSEKKNSVKAATTSVLDSILEVYDRQYEEGILYKEGKKGDNLTMKDIPILPKLVIREAKVTSITFEKVPVETPEVPALIGKLSLFLKMREKTKLKTERFGVLLKRPRYDMSGNGWEEYLNLLQEDLKKEGVTFDEFKSMVEELVDKEYVDEEEGHSGVSYRFSGKRPFKRFQV